eukprot:342481-Heterocapsa_arctica.AAC.1
MSEGCAFALRGASARCSSSLSSRSTRCLPARHAQEVGRHRRAALRASASPCPADRHHDQPERIDHDR